MHISRDVAQIHKDCEIIVTQIHQWHNASKFKKSKCHKFTEIVKSKWHKFSEITKSMVVILN